MGFWTWYLGLGIFFFLSSLSIFAQDTIPDYSRHAHWAALPAKYDNADELPVNSLNDLQDSAKADVFYIHPTTYLWMPWNPYMDTKLLNWLTDNYPVQHQASIFNESCKVYAPRYRQATVYSFVIKSAKADSALETAYSDVKSAFQYYLSHYNKGRPIVIAAHSQGSCHAVKLLKEFFDEKPLQTQLVAAYVPGWIVKCNEFKKIPVCDSAAQTGCFVSWNSFVWGADILSDISKDACCVNPLTWKPDTAYAPRAMHKGSVPPTFNKIDAGAVDAKCVNGKLWVHLPADVTYWVAGLNYHMLDYNLFYLDVRENVKLRLRKFLETEKLEEYR